MARIRRQVGLTPQRGVDKLFPVPVISTRQPTTTDKNFELGQAWVNKTNASISFLVQVANNTAQWWALGNTWITVGTFANRLTPLTGGFGPDGFAIEVAVDTTGGSNGIDYSGIGSDLTVTTGNGTEISTGMSTTARVFGGDIESLYGIFAAATQVDGSEIDSICVGVRAIGQMDETDAADQAQDFIAGSISELNFIATAAVPTATHVAASVHYVTYDPPTDNLAHGVLVTRNGGAGAGVEAGSAFKVINGAVATNDWDYGLDLYTGSATENYDIADVRFSNQSTIVNTATSTTWVGTAGDNFVIRLGSGTTDFSIEDDAASTVFQVDNDGDTTITGGSLDIATIGQGLLIAEGANARMGIATLVAGTVTVTTTAVAANSRIFTSHMNQNASTGIGTLVINTITPATSFVITSVDSTGTIETNDISDVIWLIIDPS